MRTIVGGQLTESSKMLEEAREKAINRMVQDAEKMGANAVINVRFMASMVLLMIMAGAAKILAYGMVVRLRDNEQIYSNLCESINNL